MVARYGPATAGERRWRMSDFKRKEGLFPLLMTDRIFANIEKVMHSSPDAESISWDLNQRSLVVRFKKPAEDKSKGIGWASDLADCVVQGGSIMANLYGEVLWHRQHGAALRAGLEDILNHVGHDAPRGAGQDAYTSQRLSIEAAIRRIAKKALAGGGK